jgi:hypothetical protein
MRVPDLQELCLFWISNDLMVRVLWDILRRVHPSNLMVGEDVVESAHFFSSGWHQSI